MSKQAVLRMLFFGALAAGLLLWSRQRRPRDLALQIDLTHALPGEITEVDVIIRRGSHALARHEVSYGKAGAPGLLELNVHAWPGPAEIETTLVYDGKPAHRSVTSVDLAERGPARIEAK
jgi:hypothetical protein